MEVSTLKERIINLRKEDYTYKRIKQELDCSLSTIQYHCKNEGLNKPNINLRIETFKDYGKREEDQIINLRSDNVSYDKIQELTLLPLDFIKKVSRKYGLNKTTGTFGKIVLDKSSVNIKYKELKSLRKTADFFGVARDTVRKYIDDSLVQKTKLTKEEKKSNGSKSVILWRQKLKIKLVDYKGGKCQECEYKKIIRVLQFHHIDPKEKDFSISGKSYSFERMCKEVDKCLLLCSNCHIEVHEEIEQNGYSEIVNKILEKISKC